MTKRGRKAGVSLPFRPMTVVETTPRPAPPEELSNEEVEEWRAVVDRLPADWFARETHALLIQYCRHVVTARRIRQLIAKLEAEEDFALKDWEAALKMQQRESAILASLATKMRISQQSSYDKSKKKGSGGTSKPWDAE